MCVCMCVCVCVCVCVFVRGVIKKQCVCVCVCVCERDNKYTLYVNFVELMTSMTLNAAQLISYPIIWS